MFPGKRLQLPIVNERQLNLNQPVKDMGPNELKAYAELGQKQHDEANRELERRWRSYDDMLPKDESYPSSTRTNGKYRSQCMIRDHAGHNTGQLQGERVE